MTVTKQCVCGNVLARCRCIGGHGPATMVSPCKCTKPGPDAYKPLHSKESDVDTDET